MLHHPLVVVVLVRVGRYLTIQQSLQNVNTLVN